MMTATRFSPGRTLRSLAYGVRCAWSVARGLPPPIYRIVLTDDLPDVLCTDRVYVIGEEGVRWYVAMLCPCGCGAILHMSLHPQGRPRWNVSVHLDDTASLSPSVWRRVGCRSHFFLRAGRIEWCR